MQADIARTAFFIVCRRVFDQQPGKLLGASFTLFMDDPQAWQEEAGIGPFGVRRTRGYPHRLSTERSNHFVARETADSVPYQ